MAETIYYPTSPTGPLPFSPSDSIPIHVPLCPLTYNQCNIADNYPDCDKECREDILKREKITTNSEITRINSELEQLKKAIAANLQKKQELNALNKTLRERIVLLKIQRRKILGLGIV